MFSLCFALGFLAVFCSLVALAVCPWFFDGFSLVRAWCCAGGGLAVHYKIMDLLAVHYKIMDFAGSPLQNYGFPVYFVTGNRFWFRSITQ